MLLGKLLQTEVAECLKPGDANALDIKRLQIKFFDDNQCKLVRSPA